MADPIHGARSRHTVHAQDDAFLEVGTKPTARDDPSSKRPPSVAMTPSTFEELTATPHVRLVTGGQSYVAGTVDYSGMSDPVLANQESAAYTRKDERATRAIANEWTRRKELRSEPRLHEVETFGDTRSLAEELERQEKFLTFAANPFNGVPDSARNKHQAYVARLEERMAELERAERDRSEKSGELVTALRGVGIRLSPEEQAKLRTAYEAMLSKPHVAAPEIGPDKGGTPLADVMADARAHWEIVRLTAESPMAAAALVSATLHGDSAEQAVVRMKEAQKAEKAWSAMNKALDEAQKNESLSRAR